MAGEDTDPKSSASAAAVPYVFFSFLLEVLLQFLALVSVLRMLGSMSYKQLHLVSVLDVFTSSSYMQTMFTFSLMHLDPHDLFHHCYTSHALSSISVNKIIW